MAIPSLEVSFIQERAGAIDPAFAMPSTFDEQRAVVGPKVPEHALKAAMEQYQALDCWPKLDLDINNCSWPEVFKLLENVQEDYAAKARKGLKGAFRRMGRDAGENSDTIKPLLDIIPDEFGGSVIRSALGWMFIIAKQCAQARAEIFELFAEIPSIIMEIGEARKDFGRRDDELMRLADSAEAEIVNATLKLIKFLLPEHHLKKVFTTFSDVPSTSSVTDIVSNVRRPAQALKRHTDALMRGVSNDTNRNTRVLIRETQTTRYNTLMINGKVDQVGQQLQDIRRDEQNMLDRLTTAIEAQDGLFRFLREMRETYQQGLDSINSGLAWAFQMGVNLERHRAQTVPATLLSTDQLLLDLNVTSHQLVVDLEQALRQSSRLDRRAMGQAQQLLKMDRFWSWYSPISSDLIMVHGKFTNEGALSRISPLSATSATLVSSILRERQGDIALYFFCGQHTSSQDALAGPRGVMRCLLARLLLEVRARSHFDIYLEPASANAIVQGIRCHDMETMCLMFQLLVEHIPQGTALFCIVDGMSWLDQPSHVADTIRMIRLFRSLATDTRFPSTLKFMLTGPWSTSSFDAVTRPEEQINLGQGLLMQNPAATSPLFNRFTLSPPQNQSSLFQSRPLPPR